MLSTSSPHDPDRVVLAQEEEVDQAAPDGHLAAALDHVGAPVAGGDQPLQQLLQLDLCRPGALRQVDRVSPGPAAASSPGRPAQQAQSACSGRPRRWSRRRRVATVSEQGESRSWGRVSQAGKAAADSVRGTRRRRRPGPRRRRWWRWSTTAAAELRDPGQQEGPGHVGDHLGPLAGAVGGQVARRVAKAGSSVSSRAGG